MASWECFVCEKSNVAAATRCGCCARPRTFAPRGYVDVSRARPLALHGLTTAQHEVHPALVAALQASGLDLAATDSAGWTALHCAARLGQVAAVRCLLGSDGQQVAASLEAAVHAGGWRALHLAVRGGHADVVAELLLAGADVDARLADDEDALTALHVAATHGHAELLDLLLQCGADPRRPTRSLRRSALHVAVATSQERCVRVLLRSAAQSELLALQDADGFTALQLGALRGREATPTPSKAAAREVWRLLEAHTPPAGLGALQSALLG